MTAPDDEKPERQSVYPTRGSWRQLRTMGVEHGTTASAQIVALIEHYLGDMPERTRERIRARAREITKTRRRG